jgi:GNAT superfamily N-acetyltransferase
VTADIPLRTIGPLHLDLLLAMYDRFDPLGAALGLPPRTLEARHRWIGNALCQIVNVAVFLPAGEIVGHCFLAADTSGSAEIAVFVHQDFRRRGIGAALLKNALEWGRAVQLQRAWAVTATENRAALQLLMSGGFRLMRSDVDVAELDIDLRTGPDTRELVGISRVPAIGSMSGKLDGADLSAELLIQPPMQTHMRYQTVSTIEKEEF